MSSGPLPSPDKVATQLFVLTTAAAVVIIGLIVAFILN